MTTSTDTKVLRLLVEETVTTRFKQMQSEMDRFQQRTNQSRQAVSSFFREFGVGQLTAVGAAAGLAVFVKNSVEAAARLQELQNRAKITFGDGFARAEAQARQLGAALRRSSDDVLGLATDFDMVAKGLGFGGRAAQQMSFDLARLSVQFSKALGGSQEQAADAITMALQGSTRALKQYGITLSDAALEEYAHGKGIRDKTSEMSQAQRSLLVYNYLLERTGQIQAMAAANAGGFRDRMEELKGRWQDFEHAAGGPFLEGLTVALGAVNAVVTALGRNVSALKSQLIDAGIGQAALVSGQRTRTQDGRTVFDYTKPGFTAANEAGVRSNEAAAASIAKASDAAASAVPDFKDLYRSMAGSGGGGGEDAAKKLKQLKESLEDLARTARREYQDVGRRVLDLDRDHRKAQEDIRKEFGDTTKKMQDLRKEHGKLADDWRRENEDMARSTADLLIGADDAVKDLQERRDELEREMESTKNQGGSISVKTQDEYAKVLADLAKEQAGRAFVEGRAGPDARAAYQDRSGMSETQRRFLDSQAEFAQRKAEHEEKMRENALEQTGLQNNLKTLNDKQRKETEAYQNSRAQLLQTRDVMRTFEADVTASLANVKSATEDTVESLKDRFEELKDAISQIDALVSQRSDLTGGGTTAERVAQRRADRLLEARAAGGYTSTPFTLVGERGPEVVSLPRGSYVHDSRESRGMMGSVTINLTGMVVHREVDAQALLQRIAREVQLARLQAA